MKVARRVKAKIDGGGLVAAEVEPVKTMAQSLLRTPKETRKLRDLVWVFLAKEGLTPTEIELACRQANRDRTVITRRLPKAKAYWAKYLRQKAEAS